MAARAQEKAKVRGPKRARPGGLAKGGGRSLFKLKTGEAAPASPLKSYVVRVESDALFQEVRALLIAKPTVRIKSELPSRRVFAIEALAGNRRLPALLRDKGATVRDEQQYAPE